MCKRELASDRAVDIVESIQSSVDMTADIINPDDSQMMEKILTRDQRTTCHRVHDKEQLTMGTSAVTSECKCSIIDKMTVPKCCDVDVCYNNYNLNSNCNCNHSSNNSVNTRTKNVDVEKQEIVKTHSQVSRICDDVTRIYTNCGVKKSTGATASITWLRLGSLLVALLAVTVHGAPMSLNGAEARRLSSTPKWMNPCGFAAEEFEDDHEVIQLNDETLLGNIVMQAKTALGYAQEFRDDYIKRTFNTDYADLHSTWKDNHYDWLPNQKHIPKQLGEQLDQEFLDKLEIRMLDTALLDAYEYMQRYAVGLEQIAWDQEDYGLEFRKQFKDTEYNLRSVLCELQMAIAERGVSPRPDVTRDIMSSEYRGTSDSATFRNLRDWLIFRDYMNGLEYIVQVFEHFVNGIRS